MCRSRPSGRKPAGCRSTDSSHLLVDPESGQPVPIGTSGEIWVRGYSLMQRLYKREREDVFTPDGYYRTGDCGVQDEDGWITFTGRLGDLIKTGGGTNVTPAEVELALTNCDGVLEAYVVGAQDGDHGTVVAAAVVPRGASVLDGEALKTQLRSRSPRTRYRSSSGSPTRRSCRSPRRARSRSRTWPIS